MQDFKSLQEKVIKLDDKRFKDVALKIFRYQFQHNAVYRAYIHNLQLDPGKVNGIMDIPFLPIELFKTHQVITGHWKPEGVFTSSGTGDSGTSKHQLYQFSFYRRVSLEIFKGIYGPPDHYHILALLPSYLDRSGSSLIYMMDHFIKESRSAYSGFYLNHHQELQERLDTLAALGDRTIMIWGVSFALLDWAQQSPRNMSDCVVIETGGMKGRRPEMTREELHTRLTGAFGCPSIHSEYGMAELTSQAYSVHAGNFVTPPWMKVLIRDLDDPFDHVASGRTGGINIIDLANIHSCAFIETQDLGRLEASGKFQILGRMDNSELRGCNLMII